MRLSDILKKSTNKPVARESVPQPETQKTEIRPPGHEKPEPVDPVCDEKTSSCKADRAYTKAIIEVKNIITNIENNIPYTSQIESIADLTELIEENNEDVLILADKATPDIFLYGHCVNLCIFSLYLGKGFNFSRDKLMNLGYCALLCDIGLNDAGTGQKPDHQILKHQNINNHETLKLITNLAESTIALILNVIIQKNNQKNVQTVSEFKDPDIYDFARIITVADAYETLTHPRANKERILPHEALKSMITSANQNFDSDIIKLFIEKLSLYPPGSYVRLNSDEIGRIIGINKGLPTRPKVKVIIDNMKQRLSAPRIVDLSANPMIFVKEAIDETKLIMPDKRLMLELKAMRWWVKGL